MLKSLYLRRTLLLVLISVLLFATLTAVLYGFVARITFSRMKTSEMVDVSISVEDAVKSYLTGTLPASYVERLLTAHTQVHGTYILVFNNNADVSFFVVDDNEISNVSLLAASLKEDVESVLRGEEMVSPRLRDYTQFVIIGRPITAGQSIYGAVVLLMPMREVNTALAGLVRTLLFASLFVILLMLIPVYVLSRRFVKPLREIKNVAAAMSDGDFSVRAGNRYRGEYAELANAFDHLADGLSRTIYELSLERTRLRQMVDGLTEGIVAVDATGQITHANPAIRAMFPADSIHDGRKIGDDRIRKEFDQSLLRARSLDGNVQLRDRTIWYTLTPLGNETDRAAGAVGLFRDITESQRLEQTRRDYVANVSHELRTPLTAMRALVEPLADNMVTSDEDRGRYYSMILSEIRRLTRLINDMLELSRLQAGSVSMDRSVIDLHALLEDVTAKYAVVAEEAGLRLVPSFRDKPDSQVIINRDRIEQILIILLDNAVKYTDEGGKVILDVQPGLHHVRVEVADTGDGILPEDQPHVFERFFKADKSRRPTSGTGLGLSIAREILEAMGESIEVHSEPGRGSVFSFTLPNHNPNNKETLPS